MNKETAEQLIEKNGISGALHILMKKYPSYIPKPFRDNEDYLRTKELIKEIEASCPHQDTRTECTDFHRRDFGTICNDCGKILNTNA